MYVNSWSFNFQLIIEFFFLPGIDFPNSRYSRTDGDKNPIGISGESSLSSKFCFVSGTILNGETGALVLLTVFCWFCVSVQSEKPIKLFFFY